MSRRVQVGDEAVAVSARAAGAGGDRFVVHLGDRQVEVTARLAPDGSILFTHADGRRVRAVVTADGASRWVTTDGRTVRVREAGPGGAVAAEQGGLEAPMPGKVLDVKVAAGARVAAGDVLVVVEAMKMEHAIKAPRDGTIAAVKAATGDRVEPGTPLVTFEDEET